MAGVLSTAPDRSTGLGRRPWQGVISIAVKRIQWSLGNLGSILFNKGDAVVSEGPHFVAKFNEKFRNK